MNGERHSRRKQEPFDTNRRGLLLILAGTTGSGKTTVANVLVRHFPHLWHLETDVIRKELAGLPLTTRAATSDFRAGIYSNEMTDVTYDEANRRARQLISKGWSVILDGSFRQKHVRARAKRIANGTGIPVAVIEVCVDRSQQLSRLEQRYSNGTAISEGRPELLSFHENDWEPVTERESDFVIRVDTSVRIDQWGRTLDREQRVRELIARLRELYRSH